MDCVELMYSIHGSSIENNAIIAQTLYEQKIDGKQLVNAPDLQSFFKRKFVDNLVGMIGEIVHQ